MLKLIENHRSFKGFQKVYEHNSSSNNCVMRFALYEPDDAKDSPVLFFLSGLTCTEQNFIQKSGFQKYASEKKIVVICPDTSPRGESIHDSENWKIGQGAGFYVNAKNKPWSNNFLAMVKFILEPFFNSILPFFKLIRSFLNLIGRL